MAQGLAGQGAGETGVARSKFLQAFELEIQRAALAQYAGNDGKRGASRGKAGVGHRHCLWQDAMRLKHYLSCPRKRASTVIDCNMDSRLRGNDNRKDQPQGPLRTGTAAPPAIARNRAMRSSVEG